MARLTLEERRAHTVPARRAVQLRVAKRKVNEIVAARPPLAPEQLAKLAAVLSDAADKR